jgi:hypothetical protein
LALCAQSNPEATLETPVSARSRSSGSSSGRMSPLSIARFHQGIDSSFDLSTRGFK